MNNPTPIYLSEPLGIDEARAASRALASQRRLAEANLESAIKTAAETELTYRKAKAIEHTKAAGEGTAAQRDAIVNAATAQERYERDLAAGQVKVWQERLKGLEGERSQLRGLIELSARTFGAVA